MKYELIKNAMDLVAEFEIQNTTQQYTNDIEGFKKWIHKNQSPQSDYDSIDWEGKENGRSTDSVISTLLVHMNRFAKNYAKAAILDSDFTTQEDFIYLITLKAFGKMSKMDLIKKNVHEKSVGILIISRLITKGWILQEDSEIDKRSKIIDITNEGLKVLDQQMHKIRQATAIVSANLSESEKLELIKLLTKLNDFHSNIYHQNIDSENLLQQALTYKN